MKKVLVFAIAAAAVVLMPTFASAQTASGTLTVTATVTSSLQLVFTSDANGVALASGAGTSTATLAFGSVSAFGNLASPNITRSVAAASFTVSTPVDVTVNKANSASANYKLSAQLGSADPTNTWQVGGTLATVVTINNTTPTQLSASLNYATANPEVIAITVPFATASGTVISNTINFTATAN